MRMEVKSVIPERYWFEHKVARSEPSRASGHAVATSVCGSGEVEPRLCLFVKKNMQRCCSGEPTNGAAMVPPHRVSEFGTLKSLLSNLCSRILFKNIRQTFRLMSPDFSQVLRENLRFQEPVKFENHYVL